MKVPGSSPGWTTVRLMYRLNQSAMDVAQLEEQRLFSGRRFESSHLYTVSRYALAKANDEVSVSRTRLILLGKLNRKKVEFFFVIVVKHFTF